ncbi:MAG: hypothetical protein ACYC8U_15550 [Thermoleophilia bacterium]
MSNRPVSDNNVLEKALEELTTLLPPPWLLRREISKASLRADAVADIVAPDSRKATLVIEVKTRIDPKDVEGVLAQLSAVRQATPGTGVIAAPYLGERTRAKIREGGAGYIDLTGNVLLRIDDPAIYIERQGASKNPWRTERSARSLKGVKAARIVRALVDFVPPLGVRQIAGLAGTDPGYVSRILEMLGREDLVSRPPRGPVEEVEWVDLLRRWTEDYSLLESNRPFWFLDPRGVDSFMEKLRTASGAGIAPGYVLTGSLAARTVAPVAPARMGICFVDDAVRLADQLGLMPVDAGANVLLLEPADSVVYERTRQVDGLCYVALSQAVADLLTGPGRNPTEGEALLQWMQANSETWRVRP